MTSTYVSPRPRTRVQPIAEATPPMNGNQAKVETAPRPRMRIRRISATAPKLGSNRLESTTRIVVDDTPNNAKSKRKPNKGSFQKGYSGNLKGRPREAKGVKATIRKILETRIETKTAKGPKKLGFLEALIKKEVALAADGDWRARKTIFELAKWSHGESADEPLAPNLLSKEDITETGEAIIAWFKDEVTAQAVGQEDGL